MNKKLLLVLVVIAVVPFFLLTIFLITNRQSIRSRASAASSCPSGTQYLFTSSTNLRVGSTVALGGKIENTQSNPTMESRDGVPLVMSLQTMKVGFPNNVVLDTALIFDNDPKQGEKPWSINGQSLPVTGGGNWGPPYKLNQITNVMNFDNGGDSPHFNICVKETSPQPSPTPIPKPSSTPTPTITPTPESTLTETPIPSVTPSPSICPKPNPVTDVKITCEACQQK